MTASTFAGSTPCLTSAVMKNNPLISAPKLDVPTLSSSLSPCTRRESRRDDALPPSTWLKRVSRVESSVPFSATGHAR